jgi:hypothetical protein
VILADFVIGVEYEVPREVRVIVYDNLKGLRSAATQYDNVTRSKRRRKHGQYAETLGICHRFEWMDPKTDESKPLCAIVRLAKPHIGAGIVCHELTHAAVWIRQLNEGEAPLLSDHDEPFVWLVGQLMSLAVDAMYERGVYPS